MRRQGDGTEFETRAFECAAAALAALLGAEPLRAAFEPLLAILGLLAGY